MYYPDQHFEDAWIGVDFDGTLATRVVWDDMTQTLPLGQPIPAMVNRVKEWIVNGMEVRIVTARVAACGRRNVHGILDDAAFAAEQSVLIQTWCKEVFGKILPVTAVKDMNMIALWDDRAVTVQVDNGKILTSGIYGDREVRL